MCSFMWNMPPEYLRLTDLRHSIQSKHDKRTIVRIVS